VDLDLLMHGYFKDCPDFKAVPYNDLARQSFLAAYRYSEPALAYSLERVLRDHQDWVFDIGAGYTSFLDHRFHARAAAALRPFSRVVLVLPDPGPAESVRILRSRCRKARQDDWIREGVDFIEHWVTDEQNRRLATEVVYTGDDEPAAVVTRLHGRPASQ
jgi:hypothetical protein